MVTKQSEKILIKEGSFVITEAKRTFPASTDPVIIPMKGFNAIKITGKVYSAQITVVFRSIRTVKYPLLADPSTKKIDEQIVFCFVDENGSITFLSEPKEKDSLEIRRYRAEIEFKLINVPGHSDTN